MSTATWVESSFEVDGRRIGVLVKRVGDDEARRLAANLAWFVDAALMPDANLDESGWPQLLQRIMGEYVALTVDQSTGAQLERLWTRLCGGALKAFVQVNGLDPVVRECLRSAPEGVS